MSKTITVAELDTILKSDPRTRLIDVRSASEFASGHVPTAINVPLEEVESRLPDFEEAPVAILCQSGNRATMACGLLASHHSNLMIVEGGTDAWTSAGRSLVASTKTRWSLDRQVRLIAGIIVLAGTALSVVVAPGWVYLAMFVGAGLTFAGLTNFCGMAALLSAMPWNRPAAATPKLQQNR